LRASFEGPLPGLTLIDPGAWAPPLALPLSLDTLSIDPSRARAWLTLRTVLEGGEAMLERATVLLAPNGAAGPSALEFARVWPRYEAVADRAPLPKPVATRSLTIPPTAQAATLPFARGSSAPRAAGSLPPSAAGLPFGAPPLPSFVDEGTGGSALPFVERGPSEVSTTRPRPLMSLGGTPLAYPPTPFANRAVPVAARVEPLEARPDATIARTTSASELDPGLDDDTSDALPDELDGPDTLAPPTPSAHASDDDEHADTLPPGTRSSPPAGVEVPTFAMPAPAALPRFETISMPVVGDDGRFVRPPLETMPFIDAPAQPRPSTESPPPVARRPVVPPPAVVVPPPIVVPSAVALPPPIVVPSAVALPPPIVVPSAVALPPAAVPPPITAPRAVELPTYARDAQEQSFALIAHATSSTGLQPSASAAPQGKRVQGKTLSEFGEIRSALWCEPEKRREILRRHGLSELRWRLVERAWAEELESTLAQPDRVSEMLSVLRIASQPVAPPNT
jgi:hypothetical protein